MKDGGDIYPLLYGLTNPIDGQPKEHKLSEHVKNDDDMTNAHAQNTCLSTPKNVIKIEIKYSKTVKIST